MSNYCPEWIFSVCSIQTAKDFLSTNNSIEAIAKKFSQSLSERYYEIKFEEIVDVAEQTLHFLSEINVGDEAANYFIDYVHYKANYHSNGSERKLSGIFSSAFDATKTKEYNTKKSLKNFKATIFSIRNSMIEKASPGWLITDIEDIDWLGEVFEQEVDIFKI